MLAKRENREMYRWHFVNRLANHFSHLAFRCSRQAIDILTKRQRGRDNTRNIFVRHYTFIKMLYSFAYFPRQFFLFPLASVYLNFFFQSLKNMQKILYMEILYVWTAAFDVRLVSIFSGKYSRQVEVRLDKIGGGADKLTWWWAKINKNWLRGCDFSVAHTSIGKAGEIL